MSKEWQDRLKSSEVALISGKYKTFDTMDDLLKDLGVDENADTDSD